MNVCIDTNVVLAIFSTSHPHRSILEAWSRGRFQWAVTTEILLEYEEVMLRQCNERKATMMKQIMGMVNARHGNLIHVSPSFRFHLITGDADDDKFADCAIAAQADFIITEDRHFRVLEGAGYKPQPITPGEFIAKYL
jgi:uncharacterized protein